MSGEGVPGPEPADVGGLADLALRSGATLLEDCAQSLGASTGGRKAGALATAAAFSFYPTKNLGAYGDGGAVATDDSAIALRVERLRQYGWSRRDSGDGGYSRTLGGDGGISAEYNNYRDAVLNNEFDIAMNGGWWSDAVVVGWGGRLGD